MLLPNVFALVVLIASAQAGFELTDLSDSEDLSYEPRFPGYIATDSEDYNPLSSDSPYYKQDKLVRDPLIHRDNLTKDQIKQQRKNQLTKPRKKFTTLKRKVHPTYKLDRTHPHKNHPIQKTKQNPTLSHSDYSTYYQGNIQDSQVKAYKQKHLSDHPKLVKRLSRLLRPFFFSKETSKGSNDDKAGRSVEILPLLPSSINKHSTSPLALILTSPRGHKRHGKYIFNKKDKYGHVIANVEISNGDSDESRYPFKEKHKDGDNNDASGYYNYILNNYNENTELKNPLNAWTGFPNFTDANEPWNENELSTSLNNVDEWLKYKDKTEDENDNAAFNYIPNTYKVIKQHKKPVVSSDNVQINYGQDGSGQWDKDLSTIVDDLISNINDGSSNVPNKINEWIVPHKDKAEDENDHIGENYILNKYKEHQQHKKPVVVVSEDVGQNGNGQWYDNLSPIVGNLNSDVNSSWILPYEDKNDNLNDLTSLNDYIPSNIKATQNREKPLVSWNDDVESNYGQEGNNQWNDIGFGGMIGGEISPSGQIYSMKKKPDLQSIMNTVQDRDNSADEKSDDDNNNTKKENVVNSTNKKLIEGNNSDYLQYDGSFIQDSSEIYGSTSNFDKSTEDRPPDDSTSYSSSTINKKKNLCIRGYHEINGKCFSDSDGSNGKKNPYKLNNSNESKNPNQPKNSNESKYLNQGNNDSNESKDPNNSNDYDESKGPIQPKNSNESKDSNQGNDSNESKYLNQPNYFFESKDPNQTKNSNEPKDSNLGTDSNEAKSSDELNNTDESESSNESNTEESKDSNRSNDSSEAKDSNESNDIKKSMYQSDYSGESKEPIKKNKEKTKGEDMKIAVGKNYKLVISLGEKGEKKNKDDECCKGSYNLSLKLCKEKK